jgi:hypothetical protein
MLYFITEGNFIRIKDGDNDFRLLHKTSNCINWTIQDKIDLSIDEVTFEGLQPSGISFDGVAASTIEEVINSLKGMFTGLQVAKVYRALLTQSGTNAPVATVLENTLGDIVWTRYSTGVYFGTLEGMFNQSKTISFISLTTSGNYGTADKLTSFISPAGDLVAVETLLDNNVSDGVLYGASIEILVYP